MESSDNLASSHKTFTYQRQYFLWFTFFLIGVGGWGSIYYGIILPPPSHQIFKKGILTMEYSVNLALSHKTFTYQRQYFLKLTFLFNGVGGVNILWYNILTPPPPPPPPPSLNDIKEWQFQSRIQLQLYFIILTIYRSLITQYQC